MLLCTLTASVVPELDVVAVRVAGVGDAREVEEDEGELKQAPARDRVRAEALVGHHRHRPVGEGEGAADLDAVGEEGDAAGDAVAGDAGAAEQGVAGLLALAGVELDLGLS